MTRVPSPFLRSACAATAILGGLLGADAFAQEQPAGGQPAGEQPRRVEPEVPSDVSDPAAASTEQGQAPVDESFAGDRRQWRQEKRRDALRDTEFKLNFRTFYLDRNKFDDSESEAWAVGGWAGLKTGYFFDHLSLGATGYTSQPIIGDEDKDGTLLLAEGQEGYTVLGELYADVKFDALHGYVGRKEFDTPFINRNDTRMTPNTFEAIVAQGVLKFERESQLSYGAGYFSKIKERNSDEFTSMSEDAGADVERGVFTAGANYGKGVFSIGAIDYYSEDIINIGYAEAKLKLPLGEKLVPTIAAQITDQRSVGDDLLQGDSFAGTQAGLKVELPVKRALFTAAYTQVRDGDNMQNPWSGYPGYTSVQVQDFNRSGEGAFLARAGYDFAFLDGLSAYVLGVFGTEPEAAGQYRQTEYDLNAQWAPKESILKGFSLRVRYAIVTQDGGDVEDLDDLRVICNYALKL